MKIKIRKGSRRISLEVRKAEGLTGLFGLMFRTKETSNLLFEFNNRVRYTITGLFVFFPFLVLFLDENNRVLFKRAVYPFTFSVNCPIKFRKFVEIPLNRRNSKIVKFFVGK